MDEGNNKTLLLFSDIKFIIGACNNPEEIRSKLIDGGAKLINYLSEHVTLVVADSNCPEAEEAIDLFERPVVTSLWVYLSLKANKLLPLEAFSLNRIIFNNNIVASFSPKLTQNDVDTLAAALTFYGARVSRDVGSSTHFIAASAEDRKNLPETLLSPVSKLRIVAPDWVLDSIKLKQCCDEQLYDPSLLLPPPPPTPPKPPTPPQQMQQQISISETKQTQVIVSNTQAKGTSTIRPNLSESNKQQKQKIENSQQQQQASQHMAQSQRISQQTLPPSQLPRATRMPSQIIRGVQSKIRPQLPPNNSVQILHRAPGTIQQARIMPPDPQSKKVTINYGHYRKSGPYQNNLDSKQPPQIQQQTPFVQAQQQQQPHLQPPFQTQLQQPQPPPQSQHQLQQPQHIPVQQSPGVIVQSSRLPQPNVYHQVRGSFQNSHMPSRLPAPLQQQQQQQQHLHHHLPHQQQQNQPQQPQQQQQQQPTQVINRFQDPNAQINQRPYQVCLQPQPVNSNYSPNNIIHRQPIYYAQGPNQVQIRVPNQGQPVMRQVQGDQQVVYDNYSSPQPPPQDSLTSNPPPPALHHIQQQQSSQQQVPQPPPQVLPQQQHIPQQQAIQQHVPQQVIQQHIPQQQQQYNYPVHQSQQTYSQNHPQASHLPAASQPPLVIQTAASTNTSVITRPQFSPNLAASGPNNHQVRTIRNISHNQQEPRASGNNIRASLPNQIVVQHNSRLPSNFNQVQPQPHPSIFDHTQESNLSKIKAKVPIVTENIEYFGHNPKENVPKDYPFIGCRFMLIDYEDIDSSKRIKWCDTIKAAGGLIEDKIENLTHLICENRLSQQFNLALKNGVRCVTIHWVNDVLAQNRLSFPWKASHIPLSFTKNTQPLTEHIVSITNLKGRERREVTDMIIKTGAKFTEYFSPRNTLLICGNVGGDKYEHAIRWKTPVTNCQFISDILLNSQRDIISMMTLSKYRLFNRGDQLKLVSYKEIKEVMKPWKNPIPVGNQKLPLIGQSTKNLGLTLNSNDDSGIATGGSNNSEPEAINGKVDILDNLTSTNQCPGIKTEICNSDSSNNHQNSDAKLKIELNDTNKLKEELGQQIHVQDIMQINETSVDSKSNNIDRTLAEHKMTNEDDRQISHDNHNLHESSKQSTCLSSTDLNETPPNDSHSRKSNEPVRLLFTHLSSSLTDRLRSQALKLGLGFASSPINCTHLIVDRISRTPKFICAFSHAKYILSYKWITESHKADTLLDEKNFILQDKDGEEKFSFNLVYSWLKRKKLNKLLFGNMTFFITPSVRSNVSNVKEMIESAGGIVATKKPPTKMQIDQLKIEGKQLVVVSCEEDSHLYSTLESYGIDIVGVEFVISGILRQDIDFQAHRLTKQQLSILPETTSTPPLAQISASPPKKLRLDNSSC